MYEVKVGVNADSDQDLNAEANEIMAEIIELAHKFDPHAEVELEQRAEYVGAPHLVKVRSEDLAVLFQIGLAGSGIPDQLLELIAKPVLDMANLIKLVP